MQRDDFQLESEKKNFLERWTASWLQYAPALTSQQKAEALKAFRAQLKVMRNPSASSPESP